MVYPRDMEQNENLIIEEGFTLGQTGWVVLLDLPRTPVEVVVERAYRVRGDVQVEARSLTTAHTFRLRGEKNLFGRTLYATEAECQAECDADMARIAARPPVDYSEGYGTGRYMGD